MVYVLQVRFVNASVISYALIDPNLDLSVVDIEPITGKVLYANKMLQVNIFLAPDTLAFNWFNPGIRQNLFYP